MKYFLDTEFIEDGKTIDLISIGIVAEDGREYYALNGDCDHTKASTWVSENVLIHLPSRNHQHWQSSEYQTGKGYYVSKKIISTQILEFCNPEKYGEPEFWAYYADYDWVVFAQLFGTMMDLPKGFPMYCRDLKQWCDMLGNPELPKQESGEHNALEDARWNKKAWEFLYAIANNSQNQALQSTVV